MPLKPVLRLPALAKVGRLVDTDGACPRSERGHITVQRRGDEIPFLAKLKSRMHSIGQQQLSFCSRGGFIRRSSASHRLDGHRLIC